MAVCFRAGPWNCWTIDIGGASQTGGFEGSQLPLSMKAANLQLLGYDPFVDWETPAITAMRTERQV
ncbi:hypothetical protein [Sandarakinorhabdus sp. DWP1-3-1]|uniref:hypothetical protein n=1 Tax=Sandarakinorhabdus sp. DWP1-3-1 TaxID=2804627 RepID=UPI003CE74E91